MRTNQLRRPLSCLVAGATVVGSTAVLVAGALAVPAGAVSGAPYTTKVTVTSNGAVLQTGQPATFTAKVVATGHGTPGGQVLFTVTGADSSVASCDAGNTATLVSGLLHRRRRPVRGQRSLYRAGRLHRHGRLDLQAGHRQPGPGGEPRRYHHDAQLVDQPVGHRPGHLPQRHRRSSGAGGRLAHRVGHLLRRDLRRRVEHDRAGEAQCQIAGGLVGQTAAYLVSGSYSGDTQFAGSSGKFKQSVKPAATTVTLVPTSGTCTGDVCTVGQGTSLSFVATVTASGTDGGSGTPAGTITFAIVRPGSNLSFPCDGGTNTMPLDNTGKATCDIAAGLPAIVYYKVSATLSSPGYAPSAGTLFENSALSSTNTTASVPKNVGTGQTFDVTAVVREHPGLRRQLERQQRLPGRSRPGRPGWSGLTDHRRG
jgi:hypothetical protein